MKRLLLLLPLTAAAQTPYTVPVTCIPALATPGWAATEPQLKWNDVGICVQWDCVPSTYEVDGKYRAVTYYGTWAEFAKVPGRVATIKKAADPLKSAQDAGKRYTIVPLTDPSMAGMPK